MEKLAIKGGYPVRSSKIYYGRQWIDEDDIVAVAETLRSDFITCGPKVDEFESELAAYTTAKYAVAVSNRTAAQRCRPNSRGKASLPWSITPSRCTSREHLQAPTASERIVP